MMSEKPSVFFNQRYFLEREERKTKGLNHYLSCYYHLTRGHDNRPHPAVLDSLLRAWHHPWHQVLAFSGNYRCGCPLNGPRYPSFAEGANFVIPDDDALLRQKTDSSLFLIIPFFHHHCHLKKASPLQHSTQQCYHFNHSFF